MIDVRNLTMTADKSRYLVDRDELEALIALAVHVERLKQAGETLRHELAQWSLTERDPETTAAMCQFDHAARETPETSLAHLKAEWQADAVSEFASRYLGGHEQELAEIYAGKLRR